LFKIHAKNLEAHTKRFPPALGAVIPLSETSKVLDLLFLFIYPQRHPEVERMEFETLASLAEAAEKYAVYSAMATCSLGMRNALPDHAIQICNYAATHNYPEVANLAAPLTLDLPIDKVLDVLHPIISISWVRYYAEWLDVLHFAYTDYKDRAHGTQPCSTWTDTAKRVIVNFGGDFSSLRQLDKMFKADTATRSCCVESLQGWRKAIDARLNQISVFTDFL